jgi:hypothetical protein
MAHNGFRDRLHGGELPANRHSEIPGGRTEGKKVKNSERDSFVSEGLRRLAVRVEPGRDGNREAPVGLDRDRRESAPADNVIDLLGPLARMALG